MPKNLEPILAGMGDADECSLREFESFSFTYVDKRELAGKSCEVES